MSARHATVAAIVTILAVAAPGRASAQDVALVMSVTGPWTANTRTLQRGDRIPAGARIALDRSADFRLPGTTYAIAIWRFDDMSEGTRCSSRAACDAAAWNAPRSLGAPSTLASRMLDALKRLTTNEKRYTVAQTRSAQDTGLQDAVVQLDAGRLQIPPAATSLARGDYVVKIRTVGGAEDVMDFKMSVPGPTSIDAPALRPGVYGAALYRADHLDEMIGDVAWWLVQPDPPFNESARAFADFLAFSDRWKQNATPDDLAAVRHAYLEALAR